MERGEIEGAYGVPVIFTEQDRRDFEHLKQDMWFGNGKDSVTVRLELVEGKVDRIEKTQKTLVVMGWAIILLLVGSIISANTAIYTVQHTPVPVQHTDLY